MLQKSLGHVLLAFGARGSKARRKSDGQWIAGTFNPDGQTFAARYGFTLEETNGSPVGERGPSDDLQEVIRNSDNPFMIENNATYQVRTYWDVTDCRYAMIGELTAWDKIVKPVVDRYQVSGPVIDPIKPPAGDPCSSYKLQIETLKANLDEISRELDDSDSALDKVQGLNDDIAKIVKSVTIAPRGGGAPMNVLRKIKSLLEGVK